MIFAHGFGCDQNMWRLVAPAFEQDYLTVLYDQVGTGKSDLSAYEPAKYASLNGYADDLVEIGRVLGVEGGVFVGHSVSAMIGVLASIKAPEMFESLVLVGPSPRYIDAEGYHGGFTADQIEDPETGLVRITLPIAVIRRKLAEQIDLIGHLYTQVVADQ